MAPVKPEAAPKRRHRKNYNEPGHAHELTFSCYHNHPFLDRDRTRRWLVDSLDNARKHLNFDIWAWVIMPEHVNLIVHPRNILYDMAKIRRTIKEPVAQRAIAYLEKHSPEWLDRVRRRRGDRVEYLFWQSGGGYDRNITGPATLQKMIDYIHVNPVRRNLVERARDWKWSSAAWYTDGSATPLQPDPIPPEWGMC